MPSSYFKIFFLFFVFCSLFFAKNAKAQNPTSPFTIKLGSFTPAPTRTPTPTPIVSPTLPPDQNNPPVDPGNGGNASLVYDLVNQIKKTCGGGIFAATNIGCVSNLKLPQPVKDELWGSAFHQGWLQCLGFVRAAGALVDGASWPRIWGHAIDYASSSILPGYKWIGNTGKVNIRAGDIPIWNSSSVGHIAYATKIFDSNNFEVAEANLGCSGCVRIYPKTLDHPNLIGWLRKL